MEYAAHFVRYLFVYVPLLLLCALVALIWYKQSAEKIKTIAIWVCAYAFVSIDLLLVSYAQSASGCGFGLGDCYSDSLPDGFELFKFSAVIFYYIWIVAAALAIARRLLGVSDANAKKGAFVLCVVACALVVVFLLYLRTF